MYAHERAYHSASSFWQRWFAPAKTAASTAAPAAIESSPALDQTSATIASHLSSDSSHRPQQPPDTGGSTHEGGQHEPVKPPAPWSAGG